MTDYKNWLFNAPEKRTRDFAKIVSTSVKIQPRTILDIGCGSGQLLRHLNSIYAYSNLIGIDISEPNISSAREFLDKKATRMSFLCDDYFDYKPTPFDLIVSYSTINIIPVGTEKILEKVACDLAQGGYFVISMPYECIQNSCLIIARKILQFIKCKAIDKMIFRIGRMASKSSVADEQIIQNIGYMYILPTNVYGKHFINIAARSNLKLLFEESEASSSIAKLKHKVAVFQKI